MDRGGYEYFLLESFRRFYMLKLRWHDDKTRWLQSSPWSPLQVASRKLLQKWKESRTGRRYESYTTWYSLFIHMNMPAPNWNWTSQDLLLLWILLYLCAQTIEEVGERFLEFNLDWITLKTIKVTCKKCNKILQRKALPSWPLAKPSIWWKTDLEYCHP